MKMMAYTDSEIQDRLKELPGWKAEDKALVRMQTFPEYLDALEFVNRVGKNAEEQNHHPDMFMNYKRVTVRYWTHKANGITELDFKLAHMVEKILQEVYKPRAS